MGDPKTGDRFGKLTVSGLPISRNGRYWPCDCDCGRRGIMASITSLTSRRDASGGCAKCSRVKHGHGSSSDPTYSKYQAMKQRCVNLKHKSYPEYGGRGIKVCSRWMESFRKFLADMGVAQDGMSIERENTDGDYEPGNCKWATKTEQSKNTRRNVIVELDGIEYATLKDAADAVGLPYGTVRMRTSRYGWSVRKALTTSIDVRKRKRQ